MRFILLFSLVAFKSVFAQTDTTVFNDLKKLELHDYSLPVPQLWKIIPLADATSQEKKFEFTGIGIPETFNSEPLTALFSIRKFECADLQTAENYILGDLTSYPDKVTPAGYNYIKDTIQIASGEMAILFSTHFYRQSKHFNFSRYDLVAYSEKRKAAYLINILYKYRDGTYGVEKSLHLRDYVMRIFKALTLR